MDEAVWAKVEGIARATGVITFEQLKACGLAPSAIRWATNRRRLVRLVRGVFAIAGAAPGWEQWWLAAKVLTEESTALSHSTAGHLWGLPGFDVFNTKRIELSVSGRTNVKLPGFFIVHRPTIPPTVVKVGRHDVTSLARTVIDLAPRLSDTQLERCLDAAQREHVVFPLQLDRELTALDARVPGTGRVRDLVLARRGRATDSPLETDVRRKLRDRKLREPVLQFPARSASTGEVIMAIDFAWPDLKLALHVDSHQWHSGRVEFDRDAAQRTQLSGDGWLHFFVTRATLDRGRWLEDLASAITARLPQLDLFRASF